LLIFVFLVALHIFGDTFENNFVFILCDSAKILCDYYLSTLLLLMDKSWSRIFNKYLLSAIKRMRKFENKQQVVSEWEKTPSQVAGYIHKFMFYFFFPLGNFGGKKLFVRRLSPRVRVPLPRLCYVVVSTRQWIFIWWIFFASSFVPSLSFHHFPYLICTFWFSVMRSMYLNFHTLYKYTLNTL
jgi:hypothetical protein